MQLELTRLKAIDLESPTHPERPSHLSSASGLIRIGQTFVAIADDEMSIGLFTIDPKSKAKLLPIFAGNLPVDYGERKKLKPDFEAICLVDSALVPLNGAALIIPSGSKQNRVRGSLLPLSKTDTIFQDPTEIDFGKTYTELLKTFPNLNIEGAVAKSNTLYLFQRGNATPNQNAIIEINLLSLLPEQLFAGAGIANISFLDLGKLNGCPLGFTDAALAPDGSILFLAAAEATETTYDDGEFKGAILGLLDSNFKITKMIQLAIDVKPEGLWIENDHDDLRAFIVTDADDVHKSSELYTALLPHEFLKG